MSVFEVTDLSIAYDATEDADGATPRLDGISLRLDAGRIYDLTGPSGAGKSMLLRACAQLMTIKGGSLTLDGADSSAFSYQEWRRHVCLVPQHASLIRGTIRDNLLLPWTLKVSRGTQVPPDDELRELLQAAQLDVPLDRDAAKLSGGQAARVALLRAFATKPRVLLLDEVDAALDDASAQAVGELTVQIIGRDATCLRIRHRPPDGKASSTFHLEGGHLTVLGMRSDMAPREMEPTDPVEASTPRNAAQPSGGEA